MTISQKELDHVLPFVKFYLKEEGMITDSLILAYGVYFATGEGMTTSILLTPINKSLLKNKEELYRYIHEKMWQKAGPAEGYFCQFPDTIMTVSEYLFTSDDALDAKRLINHHLSPSVKSMLNNINTIGGFYNHFQITHVNLS